MEHGFTVGEKLRLEIVAQTPRWFDYLLPWRWHIVSRYNRVNWIKRTGGLKISKVTVSTFKPFD